MRHKAAILNPTNAIPKRVLQIGEALSAHLPVEHVCWQRFSRGNADSCVLIQARAFLFFYFSLARHLFRCKYGILLFDDMRLLPLAVVFKWLTKAKLIYNRQEVPTVDAARIIKRFLHLRFERALSVSESIETFFARRVDAVITIPLCLEGMERLHGWGVPLACLSNVPEKPDADTIKLLEKSVPNNSPTLIYSGAVSVENGLLKYLKLVRALNVLGKFDKVRLVLIGRLWKMTEAELLDLIEREKCGEFVEYHKWVPYDELKSWFGRCDIGLALTAPDFDKYQYMGEGASRKIFTYMAFGLPVVAGGAFGRVVQECRAGCFVDYENENELIVSVSELLGNRELLLRMGLNGIDAIREIFNWDVEKNLLKDIFSRVLK